MQVSLKDSRLGLRNSTTRIPFRYGQACLTRCPQAVLQVTIEFEGRRQAGYAGDCLPPSWFDKTPDKDFDSQIDDMLAVIALAQRTYHDELSKPAPLFPAWLDAQQRVQDVSAEWELPALLAGFGSSLLERALLDAICRARRVSFAEAIRSNLFGLYPGDVHRELDELEPAHWLPARPLDSVYVRHTVGLGDALTPGEVPAGERLEDGFPQALEEYIERSGVQYFKVKVSNRLDHDLDRLQRFAAVVERLRGENYRVTLDGNEQYKRAAQFDELIDAIRSTEALATFWENVLAIEQPLDRRIALDEDQTAGIRELSASKPVIIDESDGTLDAYATALELGYRGVSSKNCKGALKSILNAGLTWSRNERGTRDEFLMTGEDLCCVGVVPVQADLCLAATLGLAHVERNGHHYHPGLSYLPASQQTAALAAHDDLYARQHGIVAPRIVDGSFQIGSLQCPGFGFAVEPDLDEMQPPEEWDFASLGLD